MFTSYNTSTLATSTYMAHGFPLTVPEDASFKVGGMPLVVIYLVHHSLQNVTHSIEHDTNFFSHSANTPYRLFGPISQIWMMTSGTYISIPYVPTVGYSGGECQGGHQDTCRRFGK